MCARNDRSVSVWSEIARSEHRVSRVAGRGLSFIVEVQNRVRIEMSISRVDSNCSNDEGQRVEEKIEVRSITNH